MGLDLPLSPQISAPAIGDLSKTFVRLYGGKPDFVQAPGRVNLIGEHTDYNHGFVLPAAIQFHTTVAHATRNDEHLVVYSENYAEQVEFSLNQLPYAPHHHWSDYVVGVAHKLIEQKIVLPGANLLIRGNVPQGAGLSSSASLELALCLAFLELAHHTLDGTEMALLCQRAENEFVGAHCGIMDQFVAVHGRKNHALLLDCRSLTYRHQPIPPEIRLVLCNTMVRHSVAGGEYNLRRHECETAAAFFSNISPQMKALRDVSFDQFERHQSALPETVRKRCRHVITENARTFQAADALARNDLSRFGRLMRESHASLRDDFQVSCRELDLMVELASGIDGVYGSRMTGGGFGGCTINLVRSENVDAFQSRISQDYQGIIGQRPEIYVCVAADGVRCLEQIES
jgi:galactokinase